MGKNNGDILNFLAGGGPAPSLSSSACRSDPETTRFGKSSMSRFRLSGMNQRKPGSLVVGIDVGGLKKGFHAVAL
jgi:hypothetical protein